MPYPLVFPMSQARFRNPVQAFESNIPCPPKVKEATEIIKNYLYGVLTFDLIFHLFQMANPHTNKTNLLFELESPEAFEGRSPDFWLRIRQFIKGLRPRVGPKIGKPYFHRHGFTPIAFLFHADDNVPGKFYKVFRD